jgi:hypothetical protein
MSILHGYSDRWRGMLEEWFVVVIVCFGNLFCNGYYLSILMPTSQYMIALFKLLMFYLFHYSIIYNLIFERSLTEYVYTFLWTYRWKFNVQRHVHPSYAQLLWRYPVCSLSYWNANMSFMLNVIQSQVVTTA